MVHGGSHLAQQNAHGSFVPVAYLALDTEIFFQFCVKDTDPEVKIRSGHTSGTY